MFAERRKRRDLQRKIDSCKVNHQWREAMSARRTLDIFESNLLRQKARRMGVEIPKKPGWWDNDIEEFMALNVPAGDMDNLANWWLTEDGRSIVAKQVSDAQLAYWKRWAELLIPILSLIIAIIALLKR